MLDELVLVGEALSFIVVNLLNVLRSFLGVLDILELDSTCPFDFVGRDLLEGGVLLVRLKVGFFFVFGRIINNSKFSNR